MIYNYIYNIHTAVHALIHFATLPYSIKFLSYCFYHIEIIAKLLKSPMSRYVPCMCQDTSVS